MYNPNSGSCNIHNAEVFSSLPLPRVDVTAGSNFNTTAKLITLSSQDTWQVVLVHEVTFPALSAFLFSRGSDKLLLILGKNELCTPTTLSTASFPLSIGTTMSRLGNAIPISAVVPLHVLLQVHGELAVGSCGARDTGECIFTTTRAELLVHVLGGEEASMTTLDERLEVLDSLQGCR